MNFNLILIPFLKRWIGPPKFYLSETYYHSRQMTSDSSLLNNPEPLVFPRTISGQGRFQISPGTKPSPIRPIKFIKLSAINYSHLWPSCFPWPPFKIWLPLFTGKTNNSSSFSKWWCWCPTANAPGNKYLSPFRVGQGNGGGGEGDFLPPTASTDSWQLSQ